MTEPAHAWTLSIAELGGSQVFTRTNAALAAGDTETVTFNFTGELGVDYVLEFDDSPQTKLHKKCRIPTTWSPAFFETECTLLAKATERTLAFTLKSAIPWNGTVLALWSQIFLWRLRQAAT